MLEEDVPLPPSPRALMIDPGVRMDAWRRVIATTHIREKPAMLSVLHGVHIPLINSSLARRYATFGSTSTAPSDSSSSSSQLSYSSSTSSPSNYPPMSGGGSTYSSSPTLPSRAMAFPLMTQPDTSPAQQPIADEGQDEVEEMIRALQRDEWIDIRFSSNMRPSSS